MKQIHILLVAAAAILLGLLVFAIVQSTKLSATQQTLSETQTAARLTFAKAYLYRSQAAAEAANLRMPDVLLYAGNAIGFQGHGGLDLDPETIDQAPFLLADDSAELSAKIQTLLTETPAYYPYHGTKIEDAISSLQTSSSGGYLLVNSGKSSRFWNFSEAELATELPDNEAPLVTATIAPGTPQKVAAATADKVHLLSEPATSWEIAAAAIAFVPGEQSLVTACNDGELRILQEGKITQVGTIGEGVEQLCIDPRGNAAATLAPGQATTVLLLDSLQTNPFWQTLDLAAYAIAINPNPQQAAGEMAVATTKGTIQIRRLSDAHLIHEWPTENIVSLAYNQDGSLLAAGTTNGLIHLYQRESAATDFNQLASLNGHSSKAKVSALCFLSGQTLASGDDKGYIRLWNLAGDEKPDDLFSYIEDRWYQFDPLSGDLVVGDAAGGPLNQPTQASQTPGTKAIDTNSNPPQTGQNYTNLQGIELIWCQPGSFTMGAKNSPDFSQPFTAQLTDGFWLSKYEITQQQYLAIMEENPSANTKSLNQPVESVLWGQAVTFCDKLSLLAELNGDHLMGWQYALPTEAQWEYACRAGTQTQYSFGDSAKTLKKHANFGVSDDGFDSVAQVGKFPANPWGFHDLHGNVFEWCRDAMDYENRFYPTGTVKNPYSAEGNIRAVRGGAFDAKPGECTAHYRDAQSIWIPNANVGFRVALVKK